MKVVVVVVGGGGGEGAFVESCANIITSKILFFLETLTPTEWKNTLFVYFADHILKAPHF